MKESKSTLFSQFDQKEDKNIRLYYSVRLSGSVQQISADQDPTDAVSTLRTQITVPVLMPPAQKSVRVLVEGRHMSFVLFLLLFDLFLLLRDSVFRGNSRFCIQGCCCNLFLRSELRGQNSRVQLTNRISMSSWQIQLSNLKASN